MPTDHRIRFRVERTVGHNSVQHCGTAQVSAQERLQTCQRAVAQMQRHIGALHSSGVLHFPLLT